MFDSAFLSTASGQTGFAFAIYSITLAFLLSTLISFVYTQTFQGLSYSRAFIQAMVLSPIVTAVAMQAIGDSLARGIGMMGAFSILRFRSNLKDPRDMFFLFATLAVGIACGVGNFTIAIVGAVAFCIVVVILYVAPFVSATKFDGLLRFNLESSSEHRSLTEAALEKNCQRFSLVTLRELGQGTRQDFAYHVKLKRGKAEVELMDELRQVPKIEGVQILVQESTVEL